MSSYTYCVFRRVTPGPVMFLMKSVVPELAPTCSSEYISRRINVFVCCKHRLLQLSAFVNSHVVYDDPPQFLEHTDGVDEVVTVDRLVRREQC